MRNILFVNACVRQNSRTYTLGQKVLEKLEGETTEVRLCRENLVPLCQKQLEERNTQLAAQNFSAPLFQYARQFAAADEIVIAAPYWERLFTAYRRYSVSRRKIWIFRVQTCTEFFGKRCGKLKTAVFLQSRG